MPIFAATAATMRVWLDCAPPIETRVSAFAAMASGTMYSSLRSLLPPKAGAGPAGLPAPAGRSDYCSYLKLTRSLVR